MILKEEEGSIEQMIALLLSWDVKGLEIWAKRHLLKVSKGKYQVLPLETKKLHAFTQTG